MNLTTPQTAKRNIPTPALLGLLVSAVPMIWYPKYLLLGFFALLGQGTGAWGVLLIGYPVLLFGAAAFARSVGKGISTSTAVALSPILVLIGCMLAAGQPLSLLFSY